MTYPRVNVINFSKGTYTYRMFLDLYMLLQAYAAGQELEGQAELFEKRWPCELAKDFADALRTRKNPAAGINVKAMFHDYYGLWLRFANGDQNFQRTEAYFDSLISETNRVYKKYGDLLTKKLILAFLNEIDRRDRKERNVIPMTGMVTQNTMRYAAQGGKA